MLSFLDTTSIKSRVKLYGVMALFAAASFWDELPGFSMLALGIPLLISGLCWHGLIYLPIIDWPWLAWRKTRSGSIAAWWLCLALIVPLAAPLCVTLWKMAIAQRTIAQMELEEIAIRPAGFVPSALLIVGEDGPPNSVLSCGDICQALLWSGAVQQILVGTEFPEREPLVHAIRYTVARGTSCTMPNRSQHSITREGFCIAGKKIQKPPIDAAIRLSRRWYDPNLQVSERRSRPYTFEQQVRVYDCRKQCQLLGAQPTATGQRPGFPLAVGFALRGPHVVLRTFVLGDPIKTIAKAFALHARGFAPRPATASR